MLMAITVSCRVPLRASPGWQKCDPHREGLKGDVGKCDSSLLGVWQGTIACAWSPTSFQLPTHHPLHGLMGTCEVR